MVDQGLVLLETSSWSSSCSSFWVRLSSSVGQTEPQSADDSVLLPARHQPFSQDIAAGEHLLG